MAGTVREEKMCKVCGEREALATIPICDECVREIAVHTGETFEELVRAVEGYERARKKKE